MSEHKKYSTENRPLIIFDSNCLMCAKSLRFVIEKEREKIFLFASLDSEFVSQLKLDKNLAQSIPDSVILYHEGLVYYESTAILKISSWLVNPYSKARYLKIIPAWIRDSVYRFIAKNRYKWFGKVEQECLWIPPSERLRILK